MKILLFQASKDMHEPLIPMFFPILGAHISGAEFQYPDLSWKETCGKMANLVAESGGNKGQLSHLVEAILQTPRGYTCTPLGTARADSGGAQKAFPVERTNQTNLRQQSRNGDEQEGVKSEEK